MILNQVTAVMKGSGARASKAEVSTGHLAWLCLESLGVS